MNKDKLINCLVWFVVLCISVVMVVTAREESLESEIKEQSYEIVQLKLDKETLKSEKQRLTYEIEKEGNGDE